MENPEIRSLRFHFGILLPICEVVYLLLLTHYSQAKAAVPILTISTPKDPLSRKAVPFGSPEKHFTSYPIFPKTEIFDRISTGRPARLTKRRTTPVNVPNASYKLLEKVC